MAFNHGSIAQVLFAGINASNYIKEVSQSAEIDTGETTVLGTRAKTYIPGLQDSTLSLSGLFDSDNDDQTTSFSYKLKALQRTEFAGIYIPGYDDAGDTAFHWKGLLTSGSVSTVVDDVASAELEIQGNSGLELAKLLRDYSNNSVTASGADVGLNNTDSSSGGCSAVLHVGGLSGTDTPTLTVKVQHSADSTDGEDGTWADLISFTAATAKATEYKDVGAGTTINKYVRVSWTLTGTDPEADFTVSFSRK